MTKKINYIVREVAPDQTDFSFYFDDDGLTSAGGDYCYNLFIVAQSRWSRGFNEKEYQNIQDELEDLFNMYEDIIIDSDNAHYSSVGAMLLDLELINSIHNTHKIKAITEWLKACYDETTFATEEEETTAEYLTFKTGKLWATASVTGYSQGDYVKMVYCAEHYDDVKHYGEVWLGMAKEFYTIELDDNGKETNTCCGFIIADSQAWKDEDYKRLVCEWDNLPEDETRLEMIDSYGTVTLYEYRTI